MGLWFVAGQSKRSKAMLQRLVARFQNTGIFFRWPFFLFNGQIADSQKVIANSPFSRRIRYKFPPGEFDCDYP